MKWKLVLINTNVTEDEVDHLSILTVIIQTHPIITGLAGSEEQF